MTILKLVKASEYWRFDFVIPGILILRIGNWEIFSREQMETIRCKDDKNNSIAIVFFTFYLLAKFSMQTSK